jgi:uncharacterized protein
MKPESEAAYIAFEGDRRIASGDLRTVARAAKEALDRHTEASVFVFDDGSHPVELDFRGAVDDVLARLPEAPAEDNAAPAPRGPGRPKLGVVAREVTLLPRHWEWLARQSGGASVALRRLVDEARRNGDERHRVRDGQETAYRFMSVMAGNRPNYEDATRALFADDPIRFEKLIADWPADVRDHAARLAERVFRNEARARAG